MSSKITPDLSLLADDRERQAALDALSQAYADNRIDMTEHERRQDLVLRSSVTRSELVTAVQGLGVTLYGDSESHDIGVIVMFVILLILLAGTFVLVIKV